MTKFIKLVKTGIGTDLEEKLLRWVHQQLLILHQ